METKIKCLASSNFIEIKNGSKTKSGVWLGKMMYINVEDKDILEKRCIIKFLDKQNFNFGIGVFFLVWTQIRASVHRKKNPKFNIEELDKSIYLNLDGFCGWAWETTKVK